MYPLILTVFIDLVGFGIVLPLLPLYAQAFGAAPETVTLVAASYTLAQSLFGPVWGWLSDRIGRKPVLLITIAGTCCAYLLLAFTGTLWMLFATRFFGGAMAANMSVAHALVSDVTKPEDRARAIARLGGAAGLGFVVGPAIGGLLATASDGTADFMAPYLAAAAFSAVAFVLAIFFVRETVTVEQKTRARASGGIGIWLAPLGHGEIRLILCLMFMSPFVFAGVETVLVIWSAAAWDWGPAQTGPFYTWMGFCYVLLQWTVVGPLVRRVGERAMVTAGAAALGLGVVWMPLAGTVVELYAAAFFMILGVAANAASLTSLLSQYGGADARGRVLGLGQAFAGTGRIAGPASAGMAFGWIGIDWPFYGGLAAMIVMAVVSRRIPVRRAGDVDAGGS